MDILLNLNDGLVEFPFTNLGFAVLVVGILVTWGSSLVVIGLPMRYLWRKYIPSSYPRFTPLVNLLSLLENTIYIGSILIGQPAFIPVWLGIKLAGEWVPRQRDHDRAMYHLFLIGSAGNLIWSVVAGIALFSVLSTDWVR